MLIRMLSAGMLALLGPSIALAQHNAAQRPADDRPHHQDLATPRPTYEAMASSAFRTVTAVVPVGHRLAAEIHYFGLPDTALHVNVVQAGVSYQIALGRFGFVAPGIGYYSGVDHSAPSASVRWLVEAGPLVSEGLLSQGIDEGDGSERGQFWDGNHVSLALLDRRLELGPTWEHIHIRDEDEWKWGLRAAVRVHARVLLQAYVLKPGATEWRAGFVVR